MTLWAPTNQTGLAANWDSTVAGSFAAGATATWGSQGVTCDATQVYGPRQPSYSATGLDGSQPGVVFNGSNWFNTALNASTGAHTYGAIFKSQPAGANYSLLGGGDNSQIQWRINADGTVAFNKQYQEGIGSSVDPVTGSTVQIVVSSYDTSTGRWTHRVNGQATTTGVTAFGTATASTHVMGADQTAGGEQFTGAIGQMLAYSVAPTNDNLAQIIEGYLAAKWGYQSLLPISHPFKSAAPTVSGTGSTGTATITEDGDTLVATNVVATVAGGSAFVQDPVTGDLEVDPVTGEYITVPTTGPITDTGASSATEASDTASGAGTVTGSTGKITGSARIIEAGDTTSANNIPAGTGTPSARAAAVAVNVLALVADLRTLDDIAAADTEDRALLETYQAEVNSLLGTGLDAGVVAGLGRLQSGLSRIAALAA